MNRTDLLIVGYGSIIISRLTDEKYAIILAIMGIILLAAYLISLFKKRTK